MYPARLDDRLRVAVDVTRFGRRSTRVNFDVQHVRARRLAAAGHEVLVYTDRQMMQPRSIPADLKTLLSPFNLGESEGRDRLGFPALEGV